MEKYTLNQANARDILEQSKSSSPITLVALDYNWGPPVSGRFDRDFYQIWAAARLDLRPRTVKLVSNIEQYWQPQKWSDKPAFTPVEDCGDYRLYFLSAPTYFSEFVIKMETGDGQTYYDNNGGFGINYRIMPHSGRGTTAIAGDGAIYKLTNITAIKLLWRDESAK